MKKTLRRTRNQEPLTVLHIQIGTERYNFLKALCNAKGIPMGGFVDDLLVRKLEKHLQRNAGLIQSVDLSS